jgi:hypothetical protein
MVAQGVSHCRNVFRISTIFATSSQAFSVVFSDTDPIHATINHLGLLHDPPTILTTSLRVLDIEPSGRLRLTA